MKKAVFCLLCLWGLVRIAHSQELNCNVIVNDNQVQTQERQVIQQMREAVQQFMNTTKWTNDNYKQHEKIKCNVLITLLGSTEVSTGRYAANVQVQSSRPVHGTNYETTLLTFFDRNFNFEFFPSQPLIFTENVYSTNLTAMLAYYAYAMLALDYDSFAPQGGTPYLERLLNILNNSQQANAPGWASNDTRNRYWISENLNNPQATPYREAMYLYHRQGIDLMASKPADARRNMLEALKKIKQFQTVKPTAVMINAFFDSKTDELVNLFSQGEAAVRREAADLLSQLDPPNSARYRQLAGR